MNELFNSEKPHLTPWIALILSAEATFVVYGNIYQSIFVIDDFLRKVNNTGMLIRTVALFSSLVFVTHLIQTQVETF